MKDIVEPPALRRQMRR